ncbi:glycoside hydrolase family 2 TIM barrel-domain containing protein [Mucilaginibacter paludis]|uniref:Glycoside hydrolase family 2 sugar binding n=1 Tax=Mucilaginibacter paludis DSM 18603 TaxID=714943 RepID=H1YER1_9SPHI|nr:glycoside hydrolase family 2 TIM barrel-domain containing protein [Mucilaginibacter paludis]EHQ30821.1 glycoside hydrolase family 2 sugar binding [Mucilaginibacter paludis DSM 18603]
MKLKLYLCAVLLLGYAMAFGQEHQASQNFNSNWKFFLGNDSTAFRPDFDDSKWRKLSLPHDWSIEGQFSEKHSSTTNEGALPTGIGWYRKTFAMPLSSKNENVFIDFDGIYKNSEVWINGYYLGKRPNGYISFRYDLTDHLYFGNKLNVIAVKVDNSAQPNSRWYTGSGIYRNVWLVSKNATHFNQWETVITTPKAEGNVATIHVNTQIHRVNMKRTSLVTTIYDAGGKLVGSDRYDMDEGWQAQADVKIKQPQLWSVNHPYLYHVKLQLLVAGKLVDSYQSTFGIRYFKFDQDKGFSLNGKPLKIRGVCMHHDMGALGAAVNTRAMERQLQILKAMGCNAIRTSHNPPAPEFLELCDKMGFLVMDEAFDMWAKKKNKFDYHLDWAKWHKVDLEDQIKRDRNHPSVFIWSIGNEIREQFDSTGISIGKELVGIVKKLDNTRPVTSALSENDPKKNFIYQSHALDLVGLNYHQEAYADFPKNYPGEKFIATETMSALETRGHYDKVSDTTVLWPHNSKSKFTDGNADLTVSAYDNVAAYWGTTHEATWKIIKKYDYLSGLFVWTGFDYLGEPTPYPWPARSSYFGIIDLAGFPKDVYYMYQSEWTTKPVLHILPHWNWQPGQIIDVWAYYNQADEVELFLNGKSLGIRKKQGDDLHLAWKVTYEAGTLSAVSKLNGKVVLKTSVKTAGKPARIQLIADRSTIKADGKDLSYITARVLDEQGNMVPDADDLIKFELTGPGVIAGVDNGLQTSTEPFKANQHKAFNGLCLAIIQSGLKGGKIIIKASAKNLKPAILNIGSK